MALSQYRNIDLDRSEALDRGIPGLETVSRPPEPFNLLFMKSGEDYVELAMPKTLIDSNIGAGRRVRAAVMDWPSDHTAQASAGSRPRVA